MEPFESWHLRRVAQAVEASEVSADLLAELQAEFVASQEKRPEQSHSEAVSAIAVEVQMPLEEAEAGFTVLEDQPQLARELLMRRVAEAWLEGQRKAYRTRQRL